MAVFESLSIVSKYSEIFVTGNIVCSLTCLPSVTAVLKCASTKVATFVLSLLCIFLTKNSGICSSSLNSELMCALI